MPFVMGNLSVLRAQTHISVEVERARRDSSEQTMPLSVGRAPAVDVDSTFPCSETNEDADLRRTWRKWHPGCCQRCVWRRRPWHRGADGRALAAEKKACLRLVKAWDELSCAHWCLD